MARLEAREISKEFPAVRALDGVSISFEVGEVHGLVGENGAGKSTLMNILSGVLAPTSGEMLLEGSLTRFRGVRDAIESGVVMIHQELNLVDELSAAENILLGREPSRFGFLDRRALLAEAARYLELVRAMFSPSIRVGDLSIAGKQLVEIAKAVSYEAKVLIMDEPTAVLSEHETEALFEQISRLKASGVTVIYISHILSEVLRICDRVTVLRDGKVVGSADAGSTTQADLARMMVGRELGDYYPEKSPVPQAAPALEVTGLSVPGRVKDVSFSVAPGEILGIAGLVGAGRTETAEAVVGARARSSGVIEVGGQRVSIDSPRAAMRHGIAYVSEDRKGLGLILEMDTPANVTLANLSEYGSPLLNFGRERRSVGDWIQKLSIRVGDRRAPVRFLSGGNQQKVSLAKWLDTKPSVLILDEPTRGIDIGSKREIYALVKGLADGGLACVVISSELPELIGICHRVIVLRRGELVGELSGESITEEAIMLLAAGVSAGAA
jgi:ribose transport system ATP-binding protein